MLKMIVPLCFFVAAVAGQFQPQDNGQAQLRYPLPPQPPTNSKQIISPPVAVQSVPPFQLKPCRRRSFGNPPTSPETGWVALPQQKISPVLPIGNYPAQSQLMPQALTENRPSAINTNRQTEEAAPNPEVPNKILSIEVPPIPDQNKANSPEEQNDCDRVDQDSRNSDSENSAEAAGRDAPDEVQDKALTLLSNCVQQVRSGQEDNQIATRRSASEPSREPLVGSPKSALNSANNVNDKNAEGRSNPVQENIEPQFENPAKNAGKLQGDHHVTLWENGRVCYACSTYFDPSCWKPNATTTVKYCNRDNNACLSKTFKVEGKSILIRDCGHTCNDPDPSGVSPKVKSCSICHNDMCNGAHALYSLTALLVTFIVYTVKHIL